MAQQVASNRASLQSATSALSADEPRHKDWAKSKGGLQDFPEQLKARETHSRLLELKSSRTCIKPKPQTPPPQSNPESPKSTNCRAPKALADPPRPAQGDKPPAPQA